MLLVDDDEPDVGDRREDRRARPDADLRLAGAQPRATRRGARPAESLECRTATVSPKRSAKRETICGVSAISGTSTIAPRPCGERRGRGLQVDLRLARAGDAVQQQPRRIACRDRRLDLGERGRLVGGELPAARRRAPTAACSGARRTARRSSRTSPRRSRRRSAGRSAAGDPRRRPTRAARPGGP